MIKWVDVRGSSQNDFINKEIVEELDKDGWRLISIVGDIDLSVRLGVPLLGVFQKDDKPAPVEKKTVGDILEQKKTSPKTKAKSKKKGGYKYSRLIDEDKK